MGATMANDPAARGADNEVENEDADPVGDGQSDARYAATQPPQPGLPNPEPDTPLPPPVDAPGEHPDKPGGPVAPGNGAPR
jgi:hypothetical protein